VRVLILLLLLGTIAHAETFSVVVHRPADIADAAFVDAQIAAANFHFAAVGGSFAVTATDERSVARVDDTAARVALRKHIKGKAIHVFITGRLADVDIEGAEIRGVTLRHGSRKYIILSAIASDMVLAHELGHLFGLPHSSYDVSIMNKTKREAPPPAERTFAPEEQALLRTAIPKAARRYATR
jgi:hypothetical protein